MERRTLKVWNCGSGRQSAAGVLMSCEGELPRPDVVIMADTGWERKQTLRYFEQVIAPACAKAGIPTYIVRRRHTHETQRDQVGNIRRDTLRSVSHGTRIANAPLFVLKGDSQRGKLNRACTAEYKIDPIHKKVRELVGLKPRQRAVTKARRIHVEQWIGIATEEAQRAKGESGHAWVDLRYPLLELGMSTADCVSWLVENGYPVPVKSACIGCPFRSNASWARLQAEDPEAFADAVDFDIRLRDPRGLGRINDGLTTDDYLAGRTYTLKGSSFPAYLHPSCRPLGEIDFGGVDTDAPESFGGEC